MTTSEHSKAEYPLKGIYFYLTEGCNLRCQHCWIAPKYQGQSDSYGVLDLDLFRSIIEQAKPLGLSRVKLTGGEPLLHPRIGQILDIVRSEGLRLIVETNGTLCTRELAESMTATCENPFVAVSLDGSEAESHEWVRRVKGSFEAALTGITNLVSAGIRPQVIMSVMRRNRNQVEAVTRLAESLGAGSVKFNIVQPTAGGERMREDGETLTIEELDELGRWVEDTLSASASLRLIYDWPPAFRSLSRMFGSNGDGCGVCGILKILGVLSSGSYALCGIGQAIPELVFGHAGKDRLEDIWMNTAVLKELREGLPGRLDGICGNCVMNSICLGSCIAQNYYSSRYLWAPYWYCEEARNAGLFPETRICPEPI